MSCSRHNQTPPRLPRPQRKSEQTWKLIQTKNLRAVSTACSDQMRSHSFKAKKQSRNEVYDLRVIASHAQPCSGSVRDKKITWYYWNAKKLQQMFNRGLTILSRNRRISLAVSSSMDQFCARDGPTSSPLQNNNMQSCFMMPKYHSNSKVMDRGCTTAVASRESSLLVEMRDAACSLALWSRIALSKILIAFFSTWNNDQSIHPICSTRISTACTASATIRDRLLKASFPVRSKSSVEAMAHGRNGVMTKYTIFKQWQPQSPYLSSRANPRY